jgi:hypothetical protein
LQNQTELTYKIYSFAGVLVDAGKSLTGNAEIDLGNAPSGIYFVSFTGSAIETRNIKLIKY